MTSKTILQPPELDHDVMMLSRFGSKVHPEGRLERRIVWNLFAHLEEKGFQVARVYDGEEFMKVKTPKDAMELIFNLDEVSVRVNKIARPEHGILLILGNGIDVLSDWNYTIGDPDGFSAAMDEFDPEDYA